MFHSNRPTVEKVSTITSVGNKITLFWEVLSIHTNVHEHTSKHAVLEVSFNCNITKMVSRMGLTAKNLVNVLHN